MVLPTLKTMFVSHLYFFSYKLSIHICSPFSGLFVLLMPEGFFFDSLYILDTNLLLDVYLENVFRLLLNAYNICFAGQKLFSYMSVHLSIIGFIF